jgi:cytidylate kinase
MWKNIGLDKCVSFIKAEFIPTSKSAPISTRPAITISRMNGAGGHTVASHLADYLQARVPGHEPWTVFDQNLVQKVLEDHHIHSRIAAFMEEGHKSIARDTFEEWMGLHPSTWNIVQMTNATILRLAQLGNVILVGRGSTVITSRLKNVFHVFLVGSLEKRIQRVQEVYGLDRKNACNYVKKRDEGRRKYVKDNFNVDIDSPLLYHLTINTDMVGYHDAAVLIGDEVLRRFRPGSMPKGVATEERLAHQ